MVVSMSKKMDGGVLIAWNVMRDLMRQQENTR